MTRKRTSNNPKSKIQNPKSKILLTALALALLVIPAASPFFGDGVPRTNDLFPHLYRTFALGRALIWDGLWPRWSPELVHGYGYPVFNFFPSLSHMLIYGVHKLGFTLPNAYRIVVFIHLYTAALTSYALGRTMFHNTLSGYLAAAVYTYSPYLLYDIHVRGSVPETQTLALLPLLILGLWLLTQHPTTLPNLKSKIQNPKSISSLIPHPSSFILTALTFTALLLTHHATLFQLCFPIGLWLLLQILTPHFIPHPSSLIPLLRPLLALLLGGLLGAFFALPAVLEISATRADISISQGYTYESNFLTLAQLVDWPSFPADPALVNPPVVRPLPLVALAAAYLLILLRWRDLAPTTKRTIGVWTAVLTITIFLITPASTFIWRHIFLLQMTLYPWRLVSIASLITAILTAAAVQPSALSSSSITSRFSRLTSRYLSFIPHPSSLILFILPPLLLLTALPWLFPPREPLADTITQATVSGSEIPPFFIGTTTLGEFLPAGVDELPDTAAQQAALIAGENPDRLQRPEGVTAAWLNNNPIDAHYTITADQPLTLTYHQFYFPGWQVQLNNQQVDITPSTPHGLITFPVPTGQHNLHITFATTPLRRLANTISLIAAFIILVLAFALVKPKLVTPIKLNSQFTIHNSQFTILLSTFSLLLIWLFFTHVPTPLRRPTLLPHGILNKPQIEPLDYAGELRLLTFEQSADTITADEPVELTLYWQPQRGIGVEYVVGVQIVDQNGVIWSEQEVTRPDDWRFVAGDEPWPLDGYRLDPFILRLLDGAPPQTYQFLVGLVQKNTGQTVAAHTLGRLMVTEPAHGTRPLEDGLQPHNSTAAGLTLLGSRTDRTEARPGDPMRVTTLWQIADPTQATNSYALTLVSENGETLLTRPETISPTPPTQWHPADRFRSAPVFHLPADLPSGTHTWQLQWHNQTADLATITITAPDRTYVLPTPQHTLTATNTLSLSDGTPFATLLGYDIPFTIHNSQFTIHNSTALHLTLYWQSVTTTTTSYRVFVHLRTAAGHIIAQSDGEPAQWTRPTTSWLPPEIITDEHILQLPSDPPPGPYTLITGLYDPATGQRLRTETNDYITITPLTMPLNATLR